MKSIEEFKKEKISTNKINGGWDGIIATEAGEVAGFTYTSDYLVDEDGDGEWGSGETMSFHWTPKVNKA